MNLQDHDEPPRADCEPVGTNVTNVFKKVKNVFLMNSYNEQGTALLKEKCKVHENYSLDFLCVVCDTEICQLCKLSEHEGHETKSISLAAEEAKNAVLDVFEARIKPFEQTLKGALKEIEVQKQLVVYARYTIRESIERRSARLLSLLGIDCPESNDLLLDTFKQNVRSAAQRMMQAGRQSFAPSEPSAEVSKSAVHSRQTVLGDLVNSLLQNNLQQLDAMKADIFTKLSTCVNKLEDVLETISHVRKKLDESVKDKNHILTLELHRYVCLYFGPEKLKARLAEVCPAYTYNLQHQVETEVDEYDVLYDIFWCDRKDVIEDFIQKSLGRPMKIETPTEMATQGLVQVLRCCTEPEAVIMSMCPQHETGGGLIVSFTTNPKCLKGVTKRFSADGQLLKNLSFGLGSVATFPISSRGSCTLFHPFKCNNTSSNYITRSFYAKFMKPYTLASSYTSSVCFLRFYKTVLEAHGSVRNLQLDNHYCKIFGEAVLAFDASETGTTFAVVNITHKKTYNNYGMEDGVKYIRQVLILEKVDGHLTLFRYEPPKPAFSPTDVCFFTVNGREVLAITDMGTDTVHMACRAQDSGRFTFDRYLVDNHRDLQCPTALTTDKQGNLLVACRGGYVFRLGVQSLKFT